MQAPPSDLREGKLGREYGGCHRRQPERAGHLKALPAEAFVAARIDDVGRGCTT